MNRGQLPVLAAFALMFLVVYRMPPEDVSKLAFDIVDKLNHLELFSYPLLFAVVIGWFFHAKSMRKRYSEEYRRIGQEKSKLQRDAANIKFKSSDHS